MGADCNLDCASCGLDCNSLELELQQAEDQRYLNSITDNFKVAIAIKDTMVANSVSMETTFRLYELNDDKTEVVKEGLLFPQENTVRATSLADYFNKMKIKVIISGGIAPTLKKNIEDVGIQVISNARGSHSFVLKQYLGGKLN